MKINPPKLVGLTGGIGSGKSTVAKIFNLLYIPVYYADDRAKWLMVNSPALTSAIKENFGPESYLEDGNLNRVFLGEKVFKDHDLTNLINSLVHPEVKLDFEKWAALQSTPYVIKEAALLFETGSYKQLDWVINVSSPLKTRIARILYRDPHRDEEQVNGIIDKQLPDEDKNKLANYVINNTENTMLIPQVLDIHKKIIDNIM